MKRVVGAQQWEAAMLGIAAVVHDRGIWTGGRAIRIAQSNADAVFRIEVL